MKVHFAATLLLSSPIPLPTSYSFRIFQACLTLLYCSYVKFMYSINSIWLSIFYLLLSIIYTALYINDLVVWCIEQFNPIFIFCSIGCVLYQLSEVYLVFRNERLKLVKGQKACLEKYHLCLLYFALGTSWSSAKCVIFYLYKEYRTFAFLLTTDLVLSLVMFVVNTNLQFIKGLLIISASTALVQAVVNVAIMISIMNSKKLETVYLTVMISLFTEAVSLIVIFTCLIIEVKRYLCTECVV